MIGIETDFANLSEKRSYSLSYYTKGALTHHPEGAVVLAVGKPCALRGGFRFLRKATDDAAALAELLPSSVQTAYFLRRAQQNRG